MPMVHKIILAALFFLVMYGVAEFAIWGVKRWGFAFTIPVVVILFAIYAWLDGYFSRGGLQRFVRQELPLKLQNLLANVGLGRSRKS